MLSAICYSSSSLSDLSSPSLCPLPRPLTPPFPFPLRFRLLPLPDVLSARPLSGCRFCFITCGSLLEVALFHCFLGATLNRLAFQSTDLPISCSYALHIVGYPGSNRSQIAMMMRSASIFIKTLCLLEMGYAMIWSGPKVTPAGLMAINGVSPRPTQAPGWNAVPGDLRKRAAGQYQYPPPPNWCGFIGGYYSTLGDLTMAFASSQTDRTRR